MTVVAETIKEAAYREGRDFLFIGSDAALGAGLSANFVLCLTGDAIIDELSISSDSEELTWQPFIGVDFTVGTGSELDEIARNSKANTKSFASFELDPTIADNGTAIVSLPIDIIAQVGAGNRAFIDQTLIETPLALIAGQCYLIQVVNPSVNAVRYNITFDIINEKK